MLGLVFDFLLGSGWPFLPGFGVAGMVEYGHLWVLGYWGEEAVELCMGHGVSSGLR